MAEILEILLKGEVSPEIIACWLKGNVHKRQVPENLLELENIKQEFIAYFLNYLRDHTLHLLQSSKSATPSPAKTPSLKKFEKAGKRNRGRESSKRQQLFGASPAGDSVDFQTLPSSVFSPNASLDSPGLANNYKGDRSYGKGRSNYSSQKYSPQCGSQRSPYMHQSDQHRSKQKLSLGEFMTTPDQSAGSQSWKKKSPHSGGRHDKSFESSFTGHGRRSGGRRKHASSPLVQDSYSNNESRVSSTPPIFSLTSANDFPPVGGKDKTINSESILFNETKGKECSQRGAKECESLTPVLSENRTKMGEGCDNNISREINFSKPDSNNFTSISSSRLQDVKHISLSDDKAKASNAPRRITPTVIKADKSVSQNSAFLVPIQETDKNVNNANAFNQFQSEEVTEMSSGFVEERELLKQEKKRLKSISQATDSSPGVSTITPKKPSFEHSSSMIETVEAVLAQVTCQDKLDLLVTLYSRCLTANLLPNVIVELYFLTQLLTAQGGNGTEEDVFMYKYDVTEENFFSSVHNTVYFAVSVLEEQRRLLSMLDRVMLRLLIENPRIAAFSMVLKIYLEELYERAEVSKGPAYPRSPIGSVSFQADTDNRMNFPNTKGFHIFKKQRDGFYELLREWEASRMNPDYNMQEIFGRRVRALIAMGSDLVNLIHFSRLFQSQLIAMCKGDGCLNTNEDDENIALLSQLKRTNPEKFKRLQERFIKPLSFGGPCPGPSFPGCQEFFRDFIMLADSPLLNQHLSDTFVAKIQELDETSFAPPDEDENNSANGDEEDRDMFKTVLLNLKLIGKFFGFVTFFPYQSTNRIPESMESTYISMRNKHQPSLDLMVYLKSAVKAGRLTVTVPWVVEFLSMMDKTAAKLDHIQAILLFLLYIQRYMWVQFQEDYSYNTWLVVSLISWLFENPMMPDGFFFSEIPEDFVDSENSLPSLAALDYRCLVDQSLFYTCCPYIGEMKTLLVEFAVGTSSKTATIRKITPVSADVLVQKSLTERQLQHQMEENFFHNHPASMKRVVDFVADRTASNFIKKFRSQLLQDSITEGKDKIMRQILDMAEGSPTNKLKDKATVITQKVAQEIHSDVRSKVTVDATKYCTERTPIIISLLLPDDQSSVVVNMAADTSKRVAVEKIYQWMAKNITTAMYQTELYPDVEKIIKSIQSNKSQTALLDVKKDKLPSLQEDKGKLGDVYHDDTLPHPSEVLIDLKDMIKDYVLRSRGLNADAIFKKFTLMTQMFERRQDLLPPVYKAFCQLTVELLIAILIHQVDLYTEEMIHSVLSLWKTHLADYGVHHIFSGRIINMLPNKEAWNRYTELLLTLYKEKLIQPSQIQDASMKFLPYLHDENKIFSVCRCLYRITCEIPELERGESVGGCLELLHDMLPDTQCEEAKQILVVLGVGNNNDGEEKITI